MFDCKIDSAILDQFQSARRIALVGTGGNLSICQHMASDIYRHTGKFCFAPDSVNQTALGGDSDWREPWIQYARTTADLVIGVSSRLQSPLMRVLSQQPANTVLFAPRTHLTLPTVVIPSRTYHEFECRALWALYMLMEQTGYKLPELSE